MTASVHRSRPSTLSPPEQATRPPDHNQSHQITQVTTRCISESVTKKYKIQKQNSQPNLYRNSPSSPLPLSLVNPATPLAHRLNPPASKPPQAPPHQKTHTNRRTCPPRPWSLLPPRPCTWKSLSYTIPNKSIVGERAVSSVLLSWSPSPLRIFQVAFTYMLLPVPVFSFPSQ